MKNIILSLFLAFPAYAASPAFYSFGKLMISFTEVDGLMVNVGCKEKNCEAYRKGKEFKDAPLTNEMVIGGKNPASVRCKTFMGGHVVIGKNSRGDEQSFCVFSDDSYLRNN